MAKELSFKKGWLQLRQCDVEACRNDIMNALNLNTRMAFLNRLNGKVDHKVTEVNAIESVFHKYHIRDVWGENI